MPIAGLANPWLCSPVRGHGKDDKKKQLFHDKTPHCSGPPQDMPHCRTGKGLLGLPVAAMFWILTQAVTCVDIKYLLQLMTERKASDLFLTSDARVHFRVEGKVMPVGTSTMSGEKLEQVFSNLLSADQRAQFDANHEINLAHEEPGVGRFRINGFRQKGRLGMVVRAISADIPSLSDLNLPPILANIVMAPRGLVLVVGSTGSGKSTALASMIDHRNSTTTGHILTVEDPIEFMHEHKQSMVSQREVGLDTHGFSQALTNAMRESPDVIMIGEILDANTMESAIAFAETGHLCLSTLHSNNADQTIGRILNFFPSSARDNILMNLSLNLRAIISLRLVRDVNGARVPAVEVLVNTPRIADLLRRGEIHEIKEAMEGSLEEGMQTFDQCLFNLVAQGAVSEETALAAADQREGLALRLRMTNGGRADFDPYADQDSM